MTKLMITTLMCCSALSLAGEPSSTAPKKKPTKTEVVAPASDAQKVDETVFGGSGGLSSAGLGSVGTGTGTASKGRAKMVRGTAPAPTK